MEKFTVEQIAKTAHEVNRAYCIGIGDNTQLPWDDAPEWQRVSAVNGVEFHRGNPNATPADSHQSWLDEKLSQGWKYGPVKDEDKKEHPCCVPYEQLPIQQRVKDTLFSAVVNSLLNEERG